MTIQWGDTGRVAYGSLKKYTFSYSMYENLYSTPNTLGTAKSGTPTDTKTIINSDLPIISPTPISTKYAGVLYLGGKNTSASSSNLYWQINKNGSSINTGNFTISANTYWTANIYSGMGSIVVGDVIDIYLWSPLGSVNYDYMGFVAVPTQFFLSNAKILKDVAYTMGVPIVPILGTPSALSTNAQIVLYPLGTTDWLNIPNSATTIIPVINLNSTFGFGREIGDFPAGNPTSTSTTNRPQYVKANLPTQITFREVLR